MVNTFSCVLQPFSFPLLGILYSILYPNFYRVIWCLETSFLCSLYILVMSPLSHVWLVNFFSQYVCSLLVLLTMSFALQKPLSFMRFLLSIVYPVNLCYSCYVQEAVSFISLFTSSCPILFSKFW